MVAQEGRVPLKVRTAARRMRRGRLWAAVGNAGGGAQASSRRNSRHCSRRASSGGSGGWNWSRTRHGWKGSRGCLRDLRMRWLRRWVSRGVTEVVAGGAASFGTACKQEDAVQCFKGSTAFSSIFHLLSYISTRVEPGSGSGSAIYFNLSACMGRVRVGVSGTCHLPTCMGSASVRIRVRVLVLRRQGLK